MQHLIGKSQWLRKEIFELVCSKKKGHFPSSFSCAEIVISLFYGGYLNINRDNYKNQDRNRLFISKGHAAMVIYPIVVDLGLVDNVEIDKFTQPDGIFRMYADMSVPTVEMTAGSLGHSLGVASGMALAAKKDKKNTQYYVIIGDGECYEGSIWEASMFVTHNKLDNVTVIVDRNSLCIMDKTENCVALEPLDEKFKAFGFDVQRIDGHSYNQIITALNKKSNGKPRLIVADTVKGKGISFVENKPLWHNKMPNDVEIELARQELEVNCIKE